MSEKDTEKRETPRVGMYDRPDKPARPALPIVPLVIGALLLIALIYVVMNYMM